MSNERFPAKTTEERAVSAAKIALISERLWNVVWKAVKLRHPDLFSAFVTMCNQMRDEGWTHEQRVAIEHGWIRDNMASDVLDEVVTAAFHELIRRDADSMAKTLDLLDSRERN